MCKLDYFHSSHSHVPQPNRGHQKQIVISLATFRRYVFMTSVRQCFFSSSLFKFQPYISVSLAFLYGATANDGMDLMMVVLAQPGGISRYRISQLF